MRGIFPQNQAGEWKIVYFFNKIGQKCLRCRHPEAMDARYNISNMTVYKFTTLAILAGLSTFALATDEYFGIYMQGVKVGYSRSGDVNLTGKLPAVKETISYSLLNSKLLGTDLDLEMNSRSRYDAKNNLLWLQSSTTSNGRTQTMTATFQKDVISILLDNSGEKRTSILKIPKGVKVVDDATSGVNLDDLTSLKKGIVVHVLDPTTISLIPNTIIYIGRKTEQVNGFATPVDIVEVREIRATTRLIFSAKGDLIRLEGPMGMEVRPETKLLAMDLSKNTRPDLANVTSIQIKPQLEQPWNLKELSFDLTFKENSLVFISDANQTGTQSENVWKIKLHPVDPATAKVTTILKAKSAQAKWVLPSLHVAVKNPKIIAISQKIIGKTQNPLTAGKLVSDWVNDNMRNNAGIGVLRDASEVLSSKEGVCRDYAILAAAILRAGNVPTKLVSGMIYDQDAFYYHAWIEVYSGVTWVPFDPTRSHQFFASTHLKLAEGNVEDAFIFKVLDQAAIKVTGSVYRK